MEVGAHLPLADLGQGIPSGQELRPACPAAARARPGPQLAVFAETVLPRLGA